MYSFSVLDCHKPLGKYKSVVLPYVINHVIIIKVAIMLPVDSWFQGSMISPLRVLIHFCPCQDSMHLFQQVCQRAI